jgi:3',5'-cyclic AMP phosphodiesterase CpdA
MLRMSAGSLLAAGLWPGALQAGDEPSSSSFTFLVVNDLHYLNEHCAPWFERVIKQIKSLPDKIDFCLLAGDLADKGKPGQLDAIRSLFKGLAFPFHVVIGNHDYVELDSRKPYEEIFPKSLNYHFEHKGWQFVGLDSSHGMRPKVAVQAPTLQWLDEHIPKLDKKKPMVVFTHFPFGPYVIFRATNADDVLDRFKEFNLKTVYSGHFHGFTERKIRDVVLTTNRCCAFSKNNHDGTKEKGFFVCDVKQGVIERRFVEVKPA